MVRLDFSVLCANLRISNVCEIRRRRMRNRDLVLGDARCSFGHAVSVDM
jgi:hypothetical protein